MKNSNAQKIKSAGLLLALAVAFQAAAPSGLAAQAAKNGMSRSMEQAIRLYHDGQDSEAMDRFMDILVKGTPSEKALANEYISKITLRMNTGVNSVKDRGADPTTLNAVEETSEKPASRRKAAAARDEDRDVSGGDEDSDASASDDTDSQKERVGDKISSKISQMRRDLLLELSRSNPVKVYMGPDGTPKALTLDTNFFFANDTSFRAGTDKMLGALSGLVFTLGKANLLILPEGSAEGDVKIKSIRRALALNSYFESRGISKSRVDINLTGADVRFPKELTNISGLIILFDYDKAPKLKDLEDMQTKGPKVSLGVYPTAISVQNSEGAIVEFSVFESPAGQPSWKFQVFQILKDGSRLQLQEISGSGPQYNQSYWNGRKKFFGAPYPSGKYMFTVTAADTEGRETSLSRLLLVRPTQAEQKALQAAPEHSETVTKAGVKTTAVGAAGAAKASGRVMKGAAAKKAAALAAKKKAAALKARKAAARRKAAAAAQGDAAGDGETSDEETVAAPAKPKRSAKARKKAAAAEQTDDQSSAADSQDDGAGAATAKPKKAAKAKKKPAAAQDASDSSSDSGDDGAHGPDQAGGAGQVSYKIYFKEEGSLALTDASEKRLAQVADNLSYYPMAKVALTGYAYSGEPNADSTAEDRVNRVAARLSEKYSIERSRMQLRSKVSDTPKSIVEIRMTGNE